LLAALRALACAVGTCLFHGFFVFFVGA
jgi:hypothetical protein